MIARRQAVCGLVVVGTAFTGLFLARGYVLPAAARWLDVGVLPQSAEFVMPLPGDEDTRPFVAAALVKAGLAEQVLVPRSVASPAVEDDLAPPNHEVIRRVLRRRGIPDSRIVFIDRQDDRGTYGDVRALADFLRSSPKGRATVVTSDYHTRRTRWILTRVAPKQAPRVSFVSAPTDHFQVDAWWQVDDGFTAIVGEYLKLAYYVLRYTPIHFWIGTGAAFIVIALACRQLRPHSR